MPEGLKNFSVYVISACVLLQINVSFYFKTLSEKLVLCSLQTLCGLIFLLHQSCSSAICAGAFPDLGLSEWKEDQCFLCKVTRTAAWPHHPVIRKFAKLRWLRPGCESRGSVLWCVLQMPVRKISLEVSALLIPFTETKFQEANRAESAKDEMLEIKLMKLNHQFVT